MVDTLDRLLTTLAVRLHAFSVCEIRKRQQLAYPSFEAVTVHYVLKGSGAIRVGNGARAPFGPQSVIIVPARQPHVLGDADAITEVVQAEDHCSLLGEGLIKFTTGEGKAEILLVCGAISASYSGGLGLFGLLNEPMVEDGSTHPLIRAAFELMLAEVASPSLGTQAMIEALMKQCLVTLLRQHLVRDRGGSPLFEALQHPRLARAVLAVIEAPAAAHTVESLASHAGMSRASFAEHFSRAFQQGPIDFVQKVRLRVATRLLATTDVPLKVIAQSVGYAGSAPFSRAFKAAYGADPTTYRAAGLHDEREPEAMGKPSRFDRQRAPQPSPPPDA